MDEEEAAELFSASGDISSGLNSKDVLPSIQAAAAMEAAAAADFPTAVADQLPEAEVGGNVATPPTAAWQQEVIQSAGIARRSAATATVAAAEAQQDPLVTEALEAAQQQRDNSLAASSDGSGMPLLRRDPPHCRDQDSRQPGDLGPGSTATEPVAASNGSQPAAQHADRHADAAQQADVLDDGSCCSKSSRSRTSQSAAGNGSVDSTREGDSHRSTHSMQLQQAWPTHPGAVVGQGGTCCVASQHQQQLQGRLWE
jgi:hypothetical protein